jgi:hypothetical protein
LRLVNELLRLLRCAATTGCTGVGKARVELE